MERHLSLEHKWHQTVKEPLRLGTLFFCPANDQYIVLSYDVTSAILVSQNNETSRRHETFFLCKKVSFVPINITLHTGQVSENAVYSFISHLNIRLA